MRQTALGDVLVLDFTETFWGGIAAAMLGDFGADVVRIESVDPKQRHFPDVDETHEPGSWNFRFDLAHRNKRSVAVDLESEKGRTIVHELVAKADLVLTDRSSAWLEERGLDLANCRKQRSDILYICGSGFGPAGLDAELPALDEEGPPCSGRPPRTTKM